MVHKDRDENFNHRESLVVFTSRALLIPFAALTLTACFERVPEGRILFKNDSMDWSYNVVVVRAGGASYALKPGERALLPKSTKRISVSRRYKDHTRFYEVECPSVKKGIKMKLIDIHLNRIAGGCKTVRAGKR